ncbi:uncharacterized protein LOC113377678 [Ctenocephalides felis]|uniref:uncharacterized protein LOC113377678 n=1 Tax=Ctenocephalides felis TaxID=7515 RepID=UPI000E6E4829|nr:uncharacterized protein LOC113377678 [Ctenocephalides felis]
MSPKCPVATLGECAITELAEGLMRALASANDELEATLCLIDLCSYFEKCNATTDVYQDLLQAILCTDYLNPSCRFLSMQLLLKETVTFLATGMFPVSYYERILQVISVQGAGLKTLNMKGVWVKEENMYYLFDIVRKLKNLNRLTIPYIANDELLHHIGESCANLKFLDISGETDITEIGIQSLYTGITRETLTVVDIGILGEENICHTDIAELIYNLPNLINLVTYSFVGKAIYHIYTRKSKHFRSKLNYIHDTETDLRTMNAILEICPDIDCLYLDNPGQGVVSKIDQLKLTKLKLHNFRCMDLHLLLQSCGETLVHLSVIQGRGTIDFSKLADHCPSLTGLEVYMMDSLVKSEEIKFLNLQNLEILHSKVSNSILSYLMTHAPKLKRLSVGDVNFTDDDIFRIFNNNEFPYLEDLWFLNASYLSTASAEIMMDRCPVLTVLGQLSGWNVTYEDLELMRTMISSANTKLALLPTGILP